MFNNGNFYETIQLCLGLKWTDFTQSDILAIKAKILKKKLKNYQMII